MEEQAKLIISWAKGIPREPDEVQIYPTNKCNLNCSFCYQQLGEYDVSEDVSVERWMEIAKELCEMGVKRILLSGGGEPLASPATVPMMELFKKNGVHGRMIHNGTLWDEELIRRVILSGWDSLMFSIDGLKESHDSIRGKSFDSIIRNLRLFKDIKSELGVNHPRIETTTVLTIKNYKDIPKFIESLSGFGIAHFNFEPVCVNNPTVEKQKLTREMRKDFMESIIPEAERIANEKHVSTSLFKLKEVKIIEKTGNLKEEILKKEDKKDEETVLKIPENIRCFIDSPCYEPWLWPKIEANGEIWPCSTVPLKTNVKEDSFKNIWFGEELQSFRKNILKSKLSNSCSNCVLTHLHTRNRIKEALKKLCIDRGIFKK